MNTVVGNRRKIKLKELNRRLDVKPPIYLDYNATTPVDERVLTRMLPYFSEQFGNAASCDHSFGWDAAEALTKPGITLPLSLTPSRKRYFLLAGRPIASAVPFGGLPGLGDPAG
jgi:Aminotransferase class-V